MDQKLLTYAVIGFVVISFIGTIAAGAGGYFLCRNMQLIIDTFNLTAYLPTWMIKALVGSNYKSQEVIVTPNSTITTTRV